MKKWSFFTLLLVLGIIHLFGFLKAYFLYPLVEINSDIPAGEGPLWITAAALLMVSAILYMQNRSSWPFTTLAGIALSQYLVVQHWEDAFLMTIANVLVLLVVTGYLFAHVITAIVHHWQKGYTHHEHSHGRLAHH